MRILCFAVKIFTPRLTAHIGFLKEGGKIRSYKSCVGQVQNLMKVQIFVGCFVGSCLRRARNMVKVLLFVENNPDESGFWLLNKKRFVLRF